MLAHAGMIGRGLEGEVERDLEPVPPRAAATNASKSSSVPSPGSIAVCPPCVRRRSPTGCPDRPGPASSALFGPCGSSGRSDGSAAGRARRSPSPRCRAAAPRPRRTSRCASDPVPAERGNISYHAPNRARSRSTSTLRTRSYRVARLRSACRAMSRGSSVDSAAATRSRPSSHRVAERRRNPASDRRAASRRRSSRNQRRAFEQFARDVLSGADLLRQLVPPAREAIDPGFDRVLVAAELVDGERRLPAIVAERASSASRATSGSPALPVAQRPRRAASWPSAIDVGARRRRVFANRPLDRESARSRPAAGRAR